MRITVTGSTGTIGSRIAARLAAQGHEVIGVARDTSGVPAGVTPHSADLTDPQAATTAIAGADAVYLTPPEGGDDPLGLETKVSRNVIEAAAAAGVGHVVAHTAVQADRGDTGAAILDNKTHIERSLAASGLHYTVLRPAWFLQNLWAARDYLTQGMVSLPWPGDMVWAATDIEDIVTAAVAFLPGEPANRGFDIHIPGGITGEQIAAAAGRVLGSDVAYYEADATPRQYVDVFPISEAHKDLYAELFEHFRATTYLGSPEPITTHLTGFTYRSIEDFMRDELFAQG